MIFRVKKLDITEDYIIIYKASLLGIKKSRKLITSKIRIESGSIVHAKSFTRHRVLKIYYRKVLIQKIICGRDGWDDKSIQNVQDTILSQQHLDHPAN